MNTLLLAVASLVDANTGQDHTHRMIGNSHAQVSSHIEHGRTIRSKSVTGLFSKISDLIARFVEHAKINEQDRRSIEKLSHMSEHMLRDIGLSYGDVKSLSSGQISLDDLAARRVSDQSEVRHLSSIRRTVVNDSIREIESANDDEVELAKCC